MPLAQAASGFIVSFSKVRPTIVGSFVALAVLSAPFLLDRHFRGFINTDTAVPAQPAVEKTISLSQAEPEAE